MEAEEAERRRKEAGSEESKAPGKRARESIYRLNQSGKVTAATSERKKMFMNETEKRADQTRKQRAELAARKGTGTLAKETERDLGLESIDNLELELLEVLSQSGTASGSAAGADTRDDMSTTSNSTINSSTAPPLRRAVSKSITVKSAPEAQQKTAAVPSLPDEEGEQDHGQKSSNEFAAELIHLLRLAKDTL